MLKDELGFDYVIIYKGSQSPSKAMFDSGLPMKPLLMLEAAQFEKLIEEYKVIVKIGELFDEANSE